MFCDRRKSGKTAKFRSLGRKALVRQEEEVRFAPDSPLERDGFEVSVLANFSDGRAYASGLEGSHDGQRRQGCEAGRRCRRSAKWDSQQYLTL